MAPDSEDGELALTVTTFVRRVAAGSLLPDLFHTPEPSESRILH
jgi:hypothetical protein